MQATGEDNQGDDLEDTGDAEQFDEEPIDENDQEDLEEITGPENDGELSDQNQEATQMEKAGEESMKSNFKEDDCSLIMNYFDIDLLKSNYETKKFTEISDIIAQKSASVMEVLIYAIALSLPTMIFSTNFITFVNTEIKFSETNKLSDFLELSFTTGKLMQWNWLNFTIIYKLLLGFWPTQELVGYAFSVLDGLPAEIFYGLAFVLGGSDYDGQLVAFVFYGLAGLVNTIIQLSESRKVYAYLN